MEEFGEGFELSGFKRAFERKDGIKAYNRVQAVERAFSRVQNYVVELAERGCRLAQLELPGTHEASSARVFDALREAGAIDASLCRNLKRTQRARSDVEHDYPGRKPADCTPQSSWASPLPASSSGPTALGSSLT